MLPSTSLLVASPGCFPALGNRCLPSGGAAGAGAVCLAVTKAQSVLLECPVWVIHSLQSPPWASSLGEMSSPLTSCPGFHVTVGLAFGRSLLSCLVPPSTQGEFPRPLTLKETFQPCSLPTAPCPIPAGAAWRGDGLILIPAPRARS